MPDDGIPGFEVNKRTVSRSMIFELCAETLDACLVAREAGADRIELCSALNVDGLTPARTLIEQAVRLSALPVHVMIRPHADGFHYDPSALSTMREQIISARDAGASGVVFGILCADKTVDVKRTRDLVQLAHPLEVTFHRAFDAVPDLPQALEDVIAARCHRVLTSGGAPDVLKGAAMLSDLIRLATDRIAVAVGGGLRLSNALQVARATGACHFHGSLPPENGAPASLSERIRLLVRTLHQS